jgi:hypothetical protein
METNMRTAFSDFQSRFNNVESRFRPGSVAPGFFRSHGVAEILRSLAISSVMWIMLAGAVYTVYSMISSGPDRTAEPAAWAHR